MMAVLIHQTQSFSKQDSSWIPCIYAKFLNVKRMKLKTNVVFSICLVVACGFMEYLK